MPDQSGRAVAAREYVRLEPAIQTPYGWWHIEVASANAKYHETVCGVQIPAGFSERWTTGERLRTCTQCKNRAEEEAAGRPQNKPQRGRQRTPAPEDQTEQTELVWEPPDERADSASEGPNGPID